MFTGVRRMFIVALLALLQAAPLSVVLYLPSAMPLMADDHDDDDDDDDGDDDDDRSFRSGGDDDDRRIRRPSGGGEDFLRQFFGLIRGQGPSGPSRQTVTLPSRAPDEIVALSLSDADLATLTAQGFEVLEERRLSALGGAVSRRLRVPEGISLTDARAAVRGLPSGQSADFNHFYRAEQGFAEDCRGAECPARLSIGWSLWPTRDAGCGSGITIGMIDTGINEAHSTFRGANLEVHRVAPEAFDASRAIHGTAVAALLVGDPATRSPGLVPAARLVAVDAFHRQGGDERADVFALIDALSFLAEEGVEVLNLSLAGPENATLADVIERLVSEQDIVVVSAVGNAGPGAEPAYPAAYDPVVAVTAVDRDGNIYRRAVRGDHVDIAAPGVNVWTAASISGARHKTGTSFAVPFVTAAAAIIRENDPDLSAQDVHRMLRELATDIGEPGPDSVFGAGLLSLEASCLKRT